MFQTFYIAKRTFKDMLRTSVFWAALALAAFIIFALLFWGWKNASSGNWHAEQFDPGTNREEESSGMMQFQPELEILWQVYGITIGFANLVSIFLMMGPLNQDIERKRIDQLIVRPLSRGHIYLGKLIAGWFAIAVFLGILLVWTLAWMQFGGMGIQEGYTFAIGIGLIAPCLIGSIVYLLGANMNGLLSGLLGIVLIIGSGRIGQFLTKLIGLEMLKLKKLIWVVYKILPPMNVIGETATDHLEKGMFRRFFEMEMGMSNMIPNVEDGLYSEMWHVWVYFAIIVIVGWLTFSRRQFN